jgi:hypothetical protein
VNVHQTEQTIARLRYLAMYDQSPLARMFRDLDAHLTAGGIPPEAWREGPDAPDFTPYSGDFTRAEIVNGTGWTPGQKFRQILPTGDPSQTTYTRAEIVNGTGWARGARFVYA